MAGEQTNLFAPTTGQATRAVGDGAHRYECPNLQCVEHGKEVRRQISPDEAADLPIRAVRCKCGCPMLYLGKDT